MDDIKRPNKENKTFKIKINHFADKENEGPLHPKIVDNNEQKTEEPAKITEQAIFKTPEQVSAEDQIIDSDIDENNEEEGMPRRKNPIQWFKSLNKKRKIIFIFIIVILTALIAGGIYFVFFPEISIEKVVTHKNTVHKIVKPVTVPSTLTGLPVDPSVNKRTVTAVMIENSIDARPQSGLDQAGVVFEAIAEGGVTRFMGVFQDSEPTYIGPVRSARPYYIEWALGFDAGYAHVGGSPDALADLTNWNVRNIDQFANSGAFQRISSRDAPHNVYTSISQLSGVESAKGWNGSKFAGFTRKTDSPSKTPTASSISLTLSGPVYNPSYVYNPATNNYTRSENGAVHNVISQSGAVTPITPKVVIAIVTPLSQGALDSSGAYYSDYNVLGSGQAYIFQDGKEITASWNKKDANSQLSFTDNSGNPIALNAGQTWITAVALSSNVSFK